MKPTRAIAFYLPQFHQIPENDRWWGEGFTEWTNVRKAKTLYRGHTPPITPGELGYYDLTDALVRERQATVAHEFNIDGFCYWHYWFGGGRRILERPFNEVLASGAPEFPFCLCWANQSWTGVWHGAPGKVLMEQTYPGLEDMMAHCEFLAASFSDKRYIRVDGKPLFLIYGPTDLPGGAKYVDMFRECLEKVGVPSVVLVAMANRNHLNLLKHFDFVMPNGPGDFLESDPLSGLGRLARRVGASPYLQNMWPNIRLKLGAPITKRYADLVEFALSNVAEQRSFIPCVLTGWDNTPRSGRRGVVLEEYSPELLATFTRKALEFNNKYSSHNLIFFKAWNEWAEGNVLEPTADKGYKYLEAVSNVLGVG